MSQMRNFKVVPTGVGRKDWSQNVELSVEPEIRSHMYRYNWAVEATLGTYAYPNTHVVLLQFQDRAGNLLNYVPSDIKYLMYDAVVSGDYKALTLGALYKYSYPDLTYLETILEIFGYGYVPISLARGHVFEAGRMYMISLNQWSEKATFNGSLIVHAYTDEVVG